MFLLTLWELSDVIIWILVLYYCNSTTYLLTRQNMKMFTYFKILQ